MNKRIRILYTIPNFNTAGSGKSVYDLVKGLDKTRFEPEICCKHNKGDFFKEIETLGVKIHLFPFTARYRPWVTFLPRVFKISRFFRKHDFDLIHSWHWSSDFSEPLAARLAGIPYVYTKKAMGWSSRFWAWKSKLSTKVVVVNRDMIDFYFSKMKHKAVRFPLAIDTKKYQPMAPSTELQNELKITESDFVIVSVANLVPVKGIEILLDAIRKINTKHNIKTLIVGDYNNEYGHELKRRYQDDSTILFIGKKLDVRPYIALADLFVIPTKDEGRREGIPNAPLEAMAMERIVLGTNISGTFDILEPFPDHMFQSGDVDGLAKKIVAIKNMPLSERQKLSKEMRARAVNTFSIEDFLKKHQTLYLELLTN